MESFPIEANDTTPTVADDPALGLDRRAKFEILGAILLALFLGALDQTIVGTALPRIVTGMTRDGTFLVEGGRIVGPVKNLRYTQSYLEALAGTVAVAAERKTLKGFLGGVVVPAIRIEGWTFTGGTEH